jgi:hypothetical protein
MKGQDFRTEDKLDPEAFNAALWRGLGSGLEPSVRDGRDLRQERGMRVKAMTPAPCASAGRSE